MHSTLSITCPACKHQATYPIVTAIHAIKQPDLVLALQHNQLNHCVCSQCQERFTVDTQLVYLDPCHHLLVLVTGQALTNLEQADQYLAQLWPELLDTTQYQLALVTHYAQLAELIAINHYSVASISQVALVKLLTDELVDQQHPEITVTARYFDLIDSHPVIQYHTDQGTILTVDYPASLQSFIEQKYPQLDQSLPYGEWLSLNEQWATDLLRPNKK